MKRFKKADISMNDLEQVNEARRWLRFALEDFEVAQELFSGRRMRHACFLAQQAAEKALKAALALEGLSIPYMHDLNAARNLLPDSWAVKSEQPDLAELTVWATESRYPGDWQEATESDAIRALADARAVYDSIDAEFRRRAISVD